MTTKKRATKKKATKKGTAKKRATTKATTKKKATKKKATKKKATKKKATKKKATKKKATKGPSVKEFVAGLPENVAPAFKKLRRTLRKNLPVGFKEEMNGGMVGYVVPLSRYPAGYHASRGAPLPFINITGRKTGLVVYHMGLYADPKLTKWFASEWKKRSAKKLDMGKSCIRLKHLDHVPYELIAELAQKVSVDEWIATYESDR